MRCTKRIELYSALLLLMILYCLDPSFLTAQNQPDSLKESQSEALKIFIGSPDCYIDFDYVRTEIAFVNYVRDRTDADVQILITTQTTGAGGKEFTIAFIGLKNLKEIIIP